MTAIHRRQTVTAADLRTLLDRIPPDTPLLVGIRDRHHVNGLLGELAVVGAHPARWATRCPGLRRRGDQLTAARLRPSEPNNRGDGGDDPAVGCCGRD
jgi:hypothetical protein